MHLTTPPFALNYALKGNSWTTPLTNAKPLANSAMLNPLLDFA